MLTSSSILRAALALVAWSNGAIASDLYPGFPYPDGVEVWCGKAYMETNASFNPGGWLYPPALSSSPLLDLKVRPRMNLYLASESYGSFLVDAPISYMHGQPYINETRDINHNVTKPFDKVFFEISVEDTGLRLASVKNVSVNSTDNEFVFSLAQLSPQIAPYSIVISGYSLDGAQTYNSTTELYYLPDRTDGGSVVKIDNLYGGLMVQDILSNTRNSSSSPFTPLFPYTYYISWDGFLSLDIDNLNSFQSWGYNMIHAVPDDALDDESFPFPLFETFLDRCDEIGLYVMYDMRWTYKNLSAVEYQVNILKKHKSLLLWYTGDEPDGQTDPLNATKITYDFIKQMDPYHPVSLVLNCYNYYYEEYTSGTDIVMADPYPIGINATFSTEWNTPCNVTYGDCGCDNCEGDFKDVADRLDILKTYQTWIGQPQKPRWGVPMAFGNDTYWPRYPSGEEEVVMNMLFVNHEGKAIVMWDFPTSTSLNASTSALSKVLTSRTITSFLLGSTTTHLAVSGQPRIDASSWTVEKQMLVSIVNMDYANTNSNVSVTLPSAAASKGSSYWGTGNWTLSADGLSLQKLGMQASEVDLLMLDLA